MKNFFLFVVLIFFFSFEAYAQPATTNDTDATKAVICSIIGYIHGLGAPMTTMVIIGASLLAIFGRMPWPALFALGVFTGVFFGAPAIVKAIKEKYEVCCPDGQKWDMQVKTCIDKAA